MKNIIEFDKKDYREFYSMLEFVNAIRKNTKVWSWAARGWTNMGNYMLAFRVSAHRHKGKIYIAVNGSDLFDVWLTNLKGEVKKEFTDIYLEDIIDVIDNEIEYISAYNF